MTWTLSFAHQAVKACHEGWKCRAKEATERSKQCDGICHSSQQLPEPLLEAHDLLLARPRDPGASSKKKNAKRRKPASL